MLGLYGSHNWALCGSKDFFFFFKWCESHGKSSWGDVPYLWHVTLAWIFISFCSLGNEQTYLPPYYFLCGPPPGLDHCLSKLAAATGEKMMCGKCIHSYRFQIVLLKADKELQVIKSSVSVSLFLCPPLSFCRWRNLGSERWCGLLSFEEPAEARTQSPKPAVFLPGWPLPCPGLRIPFQFNTAAPENQTPISAFSSSFSLPSATYLFSDWLNHPRNRTSVSQPAPGSMSANEQDNKPSSGALKDCHLLAAAVFTRSGKLAWRLNGVTFHLPEI